MNQKAHMKINHFKQFFNVHVKEIKIEIHPKMIMVWTYESMAYFRPFKSPYFFFVNFFLAIVLHICFFCFNISYIESLYYTQIKFIQKNTCI
jgi:hypothetical protein